MPALIDTKYEGNDGTIYPMSITSKIEAVAGTEPTGATTSKIKVKVSKTKKEYGISPRGINCATTVGTAPNTFRKYVFVPLRSKDDEASATYATNATITIGGTAYTIVGSKAEDIN